MLILSGWFALSVPSGMGLYWLTNNALSAAQQLHFRRRFEAEAAARASTDTGVGEQEPVEEKQVPMQSQQQGKGVREGVGAYSGGTRAGHSLSCERSMPHVHALPNPADVTEAAAERGRRFRALRQREAERRGGGEGGVALDTREHVPDAPPPPPGGKH